MFIDETAITTNMVRVRGRCLRGERLVSHVPQGEWKTITCIAGLRHDRMTAPMVIEGAMDGPAFLAYAIEARGARVEYLPAYSPDLNPIELSFSPFKAYLRKFAERTVPALCKRVGAFVKRVSRAECRNYFRHAGYMSI